MKAELSEHFREKIRKWSGSQATQCAYVQTDARRPERLKQSQGGKVVRTDFREKPRPGHMGPCGLWDRRLPVRFIYDAGGFCKTSLWSLSGKEIIRMQKWKQELFIGDYWAEQAMDGRGSLDLSRKSDDCVGSEEVWGLILVLCLIITQPCFSPLPFLGKLSKKRYNNLLKFLFPTPPCLVRITDG